MKITCLLASLLLVSSLATPATAKERNHRSVAQTHAYGSQGHEVAAPPWSAACMTDHGPSACGEPMWVYESNDVDTRYTSAF